MHSLIPLVATAVTFLLVGIVVSAVLAVAAMSHNQEYMQRKMQKELRHLHAELGRRDDEGVPPLT